ncbi:hypothetical protein CTA2_10390 [Colletotrichum tanaceti]|uniref:Uncharacterized protein n=1 Tax=Colletotrichum tanaceti TaxID=1306861 RepID=A0A4U6XCE3_9PEZI|nr:hypothetical protein CTA2_10390 [Colletotrichum tanaceti]TKW51447.1 hypothetical protein CTA1_13079 [Colletotrichum tanaceti]
MTNQGEPHRDILAIQPVLLQRPTKLAALLLIRQGHGAHRNVTAAAFRLYIHQPNSQFPQRPRSFGTVQRRAARDWDKAIISRKRACEAQDIRTSDQKSKNKAPDSKDLQNQGRHNKNHRPKHIDVIRL